MHTACLSVRAGRESLEFLVRAGDTPFPLAAVAPGETPEEAAGRWLHDHGLSGPLAGCGWLARPGESPLALVAALASADAPAPEGWDWGVPSVDAWEAARVRARQALPSLLGRRPVCAVVGCRETSARFTPEVQARTMAVGSAAARAGWTVLTGGLGGVMHLAARAARDEGGLTLGILPGEEPETANPAVEVVLPSGIGYARNYLTALGGDVMVALPGGRGTLEEICFALDFGRPVLSWGSWRIAGVDWLAPDDEAGMVRWLERRLAEVYRGVRSGPDSADHRSDLLVDPDDDPEGGAP